MGNGPEVWFPNLGIKIQHLSPVAFTLLGREIYWYGIIIGFGVISGLALSYMEAKRTGQNPETYLDFVLYALIFAVIGARLYYVAFEWEDYRNDLWRIFALREGGLAIYGGIIAGVITAYIFTKKRKINFWLFADTAAPSLLLGQMIGRYGNFFNREAFGGYTEGLFAMRYLKEQVKGVFPSVFAQSVWVDGLEYVQVHPTFLYESLWNLGIFIILMIVKRKKKFNGQIFGLYLLGYAVGRFWIEALRVDQLKIGMFAISQILSAILVFVALGLIWYLFKKIEVVEEIN